MNPPTHRTSLQAAPRGTNQTGLARQLGGEATTWAKRRAAFETANASLSLSFSQHVWSRLAAMADAAGLADWSGSVADVEDALMLHDDALALEMMAELEQLLQVGSVPCVELLQVGSVPCVELVQVGSALYGKRGRWWDGQ